MNAISNDHVDVGAYELGLLENQDKATFEAHLATCASCAAELETMSSLAALMKGLDPVEPPGDAQSAQPPVDLLRKRAVASRRRARWQIAVAAAACVAALGAGLGIGLATGSQSAPGVVALTGQLHKAIDPATGVT